jgi:hypothetical protein
MALEGLEALERASAARPTRAAGFAPAVRVAPVWGYRVAALRPARVRREKREALARTWPKPAGLKDCQPPRAGRPARHWLVFGARASSMMRRPWSGLAARRGFLGSTLMRRMLVSQSGLYGGLLDRHRRPKTGQIQRRWRPPTRRPAAKPDYDSWTTPWRAAARWRSARACGVRRGRLRHQAAPRTADRPGRWDRVRRRAQT